MAYFEMEADFELNPEITCIKKNDAYRLLKIANMIQSGDALNGINYFVNGKKVLDIEYAQEVLQVIEEQDNKFRKTHRRVWVQKGVCGNSGHYKWIKAA